MMAYKDRFFLNRNQETGLIKISSWIKFNRDKHGWIRIVEAFVSVMIVMSVLLVIIANQPEFTITPEQEISKAQKNILDQVSSNLDLRNLVLAEQDDSPILRGLIRNILPLKYSFDLEICNINNVCNSDVTPYVDEEIYVDEKIISSNLTQYSPKLLKLFFWEGGYPEKFQSVCGNGICEIDETATSCPADCYVAPTRAEIIPDLTHIVYTSATNVNIGGYVYPLVHYYNHYREFTETNGIGVTLTTRQLCNLYAPLCVNITANIRVNNTYIMTNGQFYTGILVGSGPEYNYNEFTLTYFGTDDNGNAIIVPFPTLYVNGSKFGFSASDVA